MWCNVTYNGTATMKPHFRWTDQTGAVLSDFINDTQTASGLQRTSTLIARVSKLSTKFYVTTYFAQPSATASDESPSVPSYTNAQSYTYYLGGRQGPTVNIMVLFWRHSSITTPTPLSISHHFLPDPQPLTLRISTIIFKYIPPSFTSFAIVVKIRITFF